MKLARCASVLAALAALAGAPHVPARAGGTEPTVPAPTTRPAWSVERAPEWDALFDRTSGWTGADGIYSIPFSGGEAPGGGERRTLFVFGDTFIGPVGPDDRRLSGTAMVNNTLAVLAGTEARADRIGFVWRRNRDHQPLAVFTPATPDTRRGDWYWIMDGLAIDGTLHLLALRMRAGGGGVFNFAVAGVARLWMPTDVASPLNEVSQADAPLYAPASGSLGDIILGAAVMPLTAAARVPDPDGFVYVYGHRNDPFNKKLLAARVPSEQFADFSAWRFWDGAGWSPQLTAAAPITDRVSSELSVTPLSDGRFVLVFQLDTLGRHTALRFGASPVGPFGAPVIVWRCPEPDADPDIYCYNAKAHPHLSAPGELLVSYNVNSFSFADHFANADIYRPRFLRLRFLR